MNIKNLFQYKIIKYIIIGGVSTVIHILIASIYLLLVNHSTFQSNVIGFLFAYTFSYTIQSKFVFEHKVNTKKAIKYFTVQFGALILSIIISNLFVGYNSYIKTLIIVAILPFITFTLHKFWTFKL